MRQTLDNAAHFIRDLWISQSPYAEGDYVRGLQAPGSIHVGAGKIVITNFSKHAFWVEVGHKSYNLGLKILARHGVQGKNGRYKVIKITHGPVGKFRRESVSEGTVKQFQATIPIGMKARKGTPAGTIKPYRSHPALKRPIKGYPSRSKFPDGFYTISEAAIRKDPTKWIMPAVAGRYIAKSVREQAKPLILQAVQKSLDLEVARQKQTYGKVPAWYKPTQTKQAVQKTITRDKSGIIPRFKR